MYRSVKLLEEKFQQCYCLCSEHDIVGMIRPVSTCSETSHIVLMDRSLASSPHRNWIKGPPCIEPGIIVICSLRSILAVGSGSRLILDASVVAYNVANLSRGWTRFGVAMVKV